MKKCPICGYKQKLFFSYRNFHYYSCINCLLVSTYPLPTTAIINKHYRNKFNKGNYEIARKNPEQYIPVYQDFVKTLQKRLKIIDGSDLKGKKILDIGCFTGDFLQLLEKEGAIVYGLELQKDAVTIANKKLHGKVFQADVMSYKFPQKKYDIITLLGVVEHVTNPQSLLNRSYDLLKPGGLIMIQTPNSSSILAKIARKYWPPYSPIEHIHLFGKKSLYTALQISGFQTISYNAHWKKLPICYVYKNFKNFGPEFYRLLSPFNSILLKSNMSLPFYGGEMLITAIKK